jgi:hypothetical protein
MSFVLSRYAREHRQNDYECGQRKDDALLGYFHKPFLDERFLPVPVYDECRQEPCDMNLLGLCLFFHLHLHVTGIATAAAATTVTLVVFHLHLGVFLISAVHCARISVTTTRHHRLGFLSLTLLDWLCALSQTDCGNRCSNTQGQAEGKSSYAFHFDSPVLKKLMPDTGKHTGTLRNRQTLSVLPQADL